MANVTIIKEVSNGSKGHWCLCFQWCRYNYDDGRTENGYRFIWRKPNGHLQPARGQARIPSYKDIQYLTTLADKQGWLDNH